MRTTVLVIIFTGLIQLLRAQTNQDSISVYAEEDLYEDDPYFWSNTKEISLNVTPLVSRFIPFNLGENEAGTTGMIYRKYFSTRALKFSFGARISGFNSQSEDDIFMFMALGLEKRNPISKDKKFAYTSSWELFLEAAEENLSGGLIKGYGLEYHFSKRIFIGTQASLRLGISAEPGGPVIDFMLPTDLFAGIRLY